jgi:hypothetical protein
MVKTREKPSSLLVLYHIPRIFLCLHHYSIIYTLSVVQQQQYQHISIPAALSVTALTDIDTAPSITPPSGGLEVLL